MFHKGINNNTTTCSTATINNIKTDARSSSIHIHIIIHPCIMIIYDTNL